MANNRSPLVNGEYYHIYNRGVARQSTFLSSSDYQQALLALEYYEFERPRLKLSDFKKLSSERREDFLASLNEKKENLVQVVSFAFMPNHFHLLLQQVKDGGISAFVSKFTNSYTKYFNTKKNRVGPIFQGVFKAIHIETTEQLLHLSRYIHLNPVVAGLITAEELAVYPWTSFVDYLSHVDSFVAKEVIFVFPRLTWESDKWRIGKKGLCFAKPSLADWM